MKKVLFSVFVAVGFFCLQATAMGMEMTEEETLKTYLPDLESEKEYKLKEMQEAKTEFAQEIIKDDRAKELNDTILRLKEKQIQLIADQITAVNESDKKKFEELSDEKSDIEEQMNMAYIKKEMILNVADMEERAKNYDESQRMQIEEMIQQVRKSYANVLKNEKDMSKLSRQLKQAHKDKENILKKVEIKFLELEKEKKEKELQ